MSNMPRLGIKRSLEKYLQSQNIKYVQDAFTTGVKKEVQVMIPEMQEEYTRIGLNSKLACVLNITFSRRLMKLVFMKQFIKLLL